MAMDIPSVGLGTYKMTSDELKNVLSYAITHCNYRLIDTAEVYKNEKYIGKIIADMIRSKLIKREDIFITSKLGIFPFLIVRLTTSRI